MKDPKRLTEAEANLLLALLLEAKTEAEANGDDGQIYQVIYDKVGRQILAYDLVDFGDDEPEPEPE